MRYKIHQFDINIQKDQDKHKQFLNNLRGEIEAMIPNTKITFQLMGTTVKTDFQYIIEKI